MSQHSKLHRLRFLLFPFSLLYGVAISFRHKFFDWGVYKSVRFKIPLICIGNITVGGTGKTPHIEYLIKLLSKNFKVATLSRGYKRKTSGYLLADKNASPNSIGDEPYQLFKKFKNIDVAVAEKRVLGVENLLKDREQLNAILLDDAFQHRHIQAGLNIVLIDFNRPVFKDHLLPAGNLRDKRSQLKRADILIVSKTPDTISDIEKRLWIKELNPFPYQKLFFTTIRYGLMQSVFQENKTGQSLSDLARNSTEVLLISGIARPEPLIQKLKSQGITLTSMIFPDHHNFSKEDISKVIRRFNQLKGKEKVLLTTEKDAVRLIEFKNEFKSIKPQCYYLPIEVAFLNNDNKEFDKIITNYVGKNKKIGQLYS